MIFGKRETPRSVQLTIPYRTYFTFFTIVGLLAIAYILFPVLLLLYLSVLIAITLTSLERLLMRHGWRKPVADAVLIVVLLSVLSLILFVLVPAAATQLREVIQNWPELQAKLESMLAPEVSAGFGKIFGSSSGSLNRMWDQLAIIANNTLSGILKFGIMIIVSFYMLMEGPKAYAWIIAFFNKESRDKIDATVSEICPIVESYIVGQAITSTLAAIWVFATASILGVPAALTLAVLAAVFDILPGLGFILNTVTGGLLALTVSPQIALFFTLSLLIYMLIENYILIPYIYGSKMKLSPLVVLLSLIVAGALAGIPGMIGILPIVASFRPIERHWLKRNEDMEKTVLRHERLRSKTSEDLADSATEVV